MATYRYSDPGRLKLRKNSSAASAKPSLNGQSTTSYDKKVMDSDLRQSKPVGIPFRKREKIVPVKDRINPLRKPNYSVLPKSMK